MLNWCLYCRHIYFWATNFFVAILGSGKINTPFRKTWFLVSPFENVAIWIWTLCHIINIPGETKSQFTNQNLLSSRRARVNSEKRFWVTAILMHVLFIYINWNQMLRSLLKFCQSTSDFISGIFTHLYQSFQHWTGISTKQHNLVDCLKINWFIN